MPHSRSLGLQVTIKLMIVSIVTILEKVYKDRGGSTHMNLPIWAAASIPGEKSITKVYPEPLTYR